MATQALSNVSGPDRPQTTMAYPARTEEYVRLSVRSMFSPDVQVMQLDTFRPAAVSVAGTRGSDIPSTIDELPESVSRSYDLTVTAAAQLNIPVVGSVSGGLARRVIVSERCSFKRLKQDGVERQYGYAIRMCVTVNKWNADLKVNMPFLTASAQLGVIEAQWLFQVVGLAGPKVDLNLPPTKLDVETFVIAQQALGDIIAAVRDPSTKFLVSIIAETQPMDQLNKELHMAVTRSYGLTSIEGGRTLEDARERLKPDSLEDDTLIDVYRTVAEISNPAEEPTDAARRRAGGLLGRVRADV